MFRGILQVQPVDDRDLCAREVVLESLDRLVEPVLLEQPQQARVGPDLGLCVLPVAVDLGQCQP